MALLPVGRTVCSVSLSYMSPHNTHYHIISVSIFLPRFLDVSLQLLDRVVKSSIVVEAFFSQRRLRRTPSEHAWTHICGSEITYSPVFLVLLLASFPQTGKILQIGFLLLQLNANHQYRRRMLTPANAPSLRVPSQPTPATSCPVLSSALQSAQALLLSSLPLLGQSMGTARLSHAFAAAPGPLASARETGSRLRIRRGSGGPTACGVRDQRTDC